jgi:hypothetical protein
MIALLPVLAAPAPMLLRRYFTSLILTSRKDGRRGSTIRFRNSMVGLGIDNTRSGDGESGGDRFAGIVGNDK